MRPCLRRQHALGKARWCQGVELVRDFPRAAKQAQIELYLGERPVITIKNLVFSVSVAAIFPQMAALLTGSKGGFHRTPLTPPVSATARRHIHKKLLHLLLPENVSEIVSVATISESR